MERLQAPAYVGCEYYFGIRVAAEGFADGTELGPQFAEVINFSIEYDPDLAVRMTHRLMSERRKVENRKPSMSERQLAVGRHLDSEVVRTAMGERLSHL